MKCSSCRAVVSHTVNHIFIQRSKHISKSRRCDVKNILSALFLGFKSSPKWYLHSSVRKSEYFPSWCSAPAVVFIKISVKPRQHGEITAAVLSFWEVTVTSDSILEKVAVFTEDRVDILELERCAGRVPRLIMRQIRFPKTRREVGWPVTDGRVCRREPSAALTKKSSKTWWEKQASVINIHKSLLCEIIRKHH